MTEFVPDAELIAGGLSHEMQLGAKDFINRYVTQDEAHDFNRLIAEENAEKIATRFTKLQDFVALRKFLVRNYPHLVGKIGDAWHAQATIALSMATDPIACLAVALSVPYGEHDFVKAVNKAVSLLESHLWGKTIATHVVAIAGYNSRITPAKAVELLRPYL